LLLLRSFILLLEFRKVERRFLQVDDSIIT
jgi:hypothetical protein